MNISISPCKGEDYLNWSTRELIVFNPKVGDKSIKIRKNQKERLSNRKEGQDWQRSEIR